VREEGAIEESDVRARENEVNYSSLLLAVRCRTNAAIMWTLHGTIISPAVGGKPWLPRWCGAERVTATVFCWTTKKVLLLLSYKKGVHTKVTQGGVSFITAKSGARYMTPKFGFIMYNSELKNFAAQQF
jgi:hypothetical protein